MRLPLDYVITLNGKVFIKDGKRPDCKLDIKYEKQRPTEIKMCITEEQLEAFAEKCESVAETHPAYPNLEPKHIKEIILSQGHQLVC